MSWNATINGNAWSDQNFLPNNYAQNFASLVADILNDQYLAQGYTAQTNTDMFTVATAFSFAAGQSRTLQLGGWYLLVALNDTTQWVLARVTAITHTATDNYTFTPICQSQTTTIGGASLWRVCPAPAVVSADLLASPTGAQGGTGGATVAAANIAQVQGDLGARSEEFFEDFYGSFNFPLVNEATPYNSYNWTPWTFTIPTENGAYDGDAGTTFSIYDPNHPGIFGLSVSNNGATAGMTYGATANSIIWLSAGGAGQLVEFLFMLPTLGGSGEDFSFQLGLYRTLTSVSQLLWTYNSQTSQVINATCIAAGVNAGATVGPALVAGKWYKISIASQAGGGAVFSIAGNGTSGVTHTYAAGVVPQNVVAQGMYLSISMTKLAGTQKRTLLLDYAYFRKPVTR